MPLTDAPDLMEVFAALYEHRNGKAVDDRPQDFDAPPSDTENYFGAPMPALNAPPRSLIKVFDQDQNLLVHFAEAATRNGKPEKAQLLAKLHKVLTDDALCAHSRPDQGRILNEYVYPVV